MQQKGRTEQILDRLQEMVANGQGALAPGKITLPKEELSRLLLELDMTMAAELKQYRDVTDKRAKVLREARQQAEDIIYEAEQSASRIRVSGRKTSVAPIRMLDLTETERRSLDNANEIYAASLIYTDEMMAEMQDVIDHALEEIKASYEKAVEDLQQKRDVIAANREELMSDLKSMEKEDRYQQIMEIGQLLSEELYHARKHAAGEEEYPQMSLDLDGKPQEEQTPAEPLQEEQAPAVPLQEEQAPAEPLQEEQAPAEPLQEEQAPAAPLKEEKLQVTPMQEEQSQIPQVEAPVHESDQLRAADISFVMPQEERLQQEAAASVASALEEKKKVEIEVAEITDEVSEAVKKNPQPSLSTSVIEAMKRAAKKAVLGMEEDEDDMLAGEFDEDEYEEDADEKMASYRTPTQPLDTKEVAARAKERMQQPLTAGGQSHQQMAGQFIGEVPEPELTPEELREQRHRAFIEEHEKKVREEEEKWMNAVYNPVLPDPNAIDPIVAMALQEKQSARTAEPSDLQ